ncbi:MAG: DNA polymerase IV [Alphaproteobacteria bacterium]
MIALCRDCSREVALVAGELRCPVCGSPRVVRHAELGQLTIAHIDCDAFYAAIEKRDDPSLVERPVIVGGSHRGVVLACCYVARRYGVHSAMPMFKALRACPNAVVLPARMDKYRAVGRQVRALMLETTPLVEPLSIDEAFLDLSGTEALHRGSPAQTLAGLAQRIERETGITVSIGLSYNKFLAKIASNLDKPRGFAVIGRDEALDFLKDKPIRLLWGVGESLQGRLNRDGISTIGQLRALSEAELVARYGAVGRRLARFARGEGDRVVTPNTAAKSISAETTFETDISDMDELRRELWSQCERVARRLKQGGIGAQAVMLKLKTADFKVLTRSRRLHVATQLAEVLYEGALPLLVRAAVGERFRLIGVGATGLTTADGSDPPGLFDGGLDRPAVVERTVDQIRARFGDKALVKGRSMRAKRPPRPGHGGGSR